MRKGARPPPPTAILNHVTAAVASVRTVVSHSVPLQLGTVVRQRVVSWELTAFVPGHSQPVTEARVWEACAECMCLRPKAFGRCPKSFSYPEKDEGREGGRKRERERDT